MIASLILLAAPLGLNFQTPTSGATHPATRECDDDDFLHEPIKSAREMYLNSFDKANSRTSLYICKGTVFEFFGQGWPQNYQDFCIFQNSPLQNPSWLQILCLKQVSKSYLNSLDNANQPQICLNSHIPKTSSSELCLAPDTLFKTIFDFWSLKQTWFEVKTFDKVSTPVSKLTGIKY